MELMSLQKWMAPSPSSGSPFRVIPYHARWRMNINLETFFVFPDADEETEDAEDETEIDEDIQEIAGLEEEVPSDDEEDNSQFIYRHCNTADR
jgi:hypothetical protein